MRKITGILMAYVLATATLIAPCAEAQTAILGVSQHRKVFTPVASTPSIVQFSQNLCISNPPSKAFTSSVTSGNRVLVLFSYAGGTAPSAPTDSLSTSYSLVIRGAFGSSSYTAAYIGTLTSSGTDTVSVSGTYSFGDLDILEITGGSGTTAGSVQSGTQAYNLTTTGGNALLITNGYGLNNAGTYGSTSPWTLLWNSNGCHSHGLQWSTQSSAGTYAVGFNSITNANFNWYTTIAIN